MAKIWEFNPDKFNKMVGSKGGLNKAADYLASYGADPEWALDTVWEAGDYGDWKPQYVKGNKNELIHIDDRDAYESAWKQKFKDPGRDDRLRKEIANPNIHPDRLAKIKEQAPHLFEEKVVEEAVETPEAMPEELPAMDDWMPTPKSQADIEADMGRHSTGGVDWNVGLGNVGGWDLSTQGSFNRGGEDRHGIKDRDDYNVRLNAARPMDWNAMMGAAPLGGPAAKGRYSDYEGGEYKPREMGERISSMPERGRRPAPMAAPPAAADPLQAYLDAGISRDQAEMLAANKVPPPPARRNMGGPIYAEGGRYAIGSYSHTNPHTGRTTTFSPSGGVSVHNPNSRYGTYSGMTSDGTGYLGNETSTMTSTGDVYTGSSAPWQIQQQHRARPDAAPVKSADEAFVDDLFALPGDVLGSIFGSNKKPKKEAPAKKPKAAARSQEREDVAKARAAYEAHKKERDAKRAAIDVQSAEAKLRALRDRKNPNWKKEKPQASESSLASDLGGAITEGAVGSLIKGALGFENGGAVYANMGMKAPDYTIRGPRQLPQQQGPLGALMDFGKSKALSYGLDAAFPGAGIAREAAGAVAPTFFEEGGKVPWWKQAARYAWGTGREGERARGAMQGDRDPKTGSAINRQGGGPIGGGQTKEGLMQARQMGALTQDEFLKAMSHAGYLKSSMGQKPTYKEMGGMTPGPLGMTDMLAAGKGKDVSKVKYKKTGGQVSDEMEISYHAPLAPKTGE